MNSFILNAYPLRAETVEGRRERVAALAGDLHDALLISIPFCISRKSLDTDSLNINSLVLIPKHVTCLSVYAH
jgi:hypothetical protein